MYDSKFHSAKTKTSALIQKLISPQIDAQVKDEIMSMNFVTLLTDTSNRKHQKLLPILVRGFSHTKGVLHFKLSVKNISNETSETIATELIETGV